MGGGKEISSENAAKDIVENKYNAIVVHGCSGEADILSRRLGIEPRFAATESGFTTRITDSGAIGPFCMAAMKVNMEIVMAFGMLGAKALGISGIDCMAVSAMKRDYLRIIESGKKKVIRDDFTGAIKKVDSELFRICMENGIVPVVAPIAVSPEGELLN